MDRGPVSSLPWCTRNLWFLYINNETALRIKETFKLLWYGDQYPLLSAWSFFVIMLTGHLDFTVPVTSRTSHVVSRQVNSFRSQQAVLRPSTLSWCSAGTCSLTRGAPSRISSITLCGEYGLIGQYLHFQLPTAMLTRLLLMAVITCWMQTPLLWRHELFT